MYKVQLRDPVLYWYLLPTVLHELGHTIGLDDLNDPTYGGRYAGYLMYSPGTMTAIPPSDLNYVQQTYREHESDPHED